MHVHASAHIIGGLVIILLEAVTTPIFAIACASCTAPLSTRSLFVGKGGRGHFENFGALQVNLSVLAA